VGGLFFYPLEGGLRCITLPSPVSDNSQSVASTTPITGTVCSVFKVVGVFRSNFPASVVFPWRVRHVKHLAHYQTVGDATPCRVRSPCLMLLSERSSGSTHCSVDCVVPGISPELSNQWHWESSKQRRGRRNEQAGNRTVPGRFLESIPGFQDLFVQTHPLSTDTTCENLAGFRSGSPKD